VSRSKPFQSCAGDSFWGATLSPSQALRLLKKRQSADKSDTPHPTQFGPIGVIPKHGQTALSIPKRLFCCSKERSRMDQSPDFWMDVAAWLSPGKERRTTLHGAYIAQNKTGNHVPMCGHEPALATHVAYPWCIATTHEFSSEQLQPRTSSCHSCWSPIPDAVQDEGLRAVS